MFLGMSFTPTEKAHVAQVIKSANVSRQRAREAVRRARLSRMTPDEVEAMCMPPGARCVACSAPPCCTARVFAPLKDVADGMIGRETLGKLLVENPDAFFELCWERAPGEVWVRVTTTYSCRAHLHIMEKAAAKSPSWCMVDIDRGPEAAARGNRVVVGPRVFDVGA